MVSASSHVIVKLYKNKLCSSTFFSTLSTTRNGCCCCCFGGDYLTEVINSLSNEEEKHEHLELQNYATPTTIPLCCNEKGDSREEESADVWTDIAAVMNQWAQKILDAETRHSKTVSNGSGRKWKRISQLCKITLFDTA